MTTTLAALPELDDCIHCGLCLNQCPTYRVTRLEAESPRGRIALVRFAAEGRIPLQAAADHLYLCLACRACETACPSGVAYGRIIEAARDVLGPPGQGLARAIVRAALRYLMPSPRRLRLAASAIRLAQRTGVVALARRLPGTLGRRAAMLPPVSRAFYEPPASVLPAVGERRARVGFLAGCAMSLFFAETNEATVRVLRRSGCEVVIPRGQACCGALNAHNGEGDSARAMARRNIDAFPDDLDAIVTNAAGCGAAMKAYGHLLRDDPRYAERARRFAAKVRDAAECLAALGLRAAPRPNHAIVTYQDPCHLVHGQQVREQPRALLAAVPGLALREMEAADRCCGSAGIYNVLQPEMAETLLREKMEMIRATGAQVVVAPNPGCMLQLRYGAQRFGVPVRVVHLMDLLDEAGA